LSGRETEIKTLSSTKAHLKSEISGKNQPIKEKDMVKNKLKKSMVKMLMQLFPFIIIYLKIKES
jgi:predicted nucleic acid binding AN1-type Zn finger protein